MSFPPNRFSESSPAPITLTTDFGLADPYVAAMKGVILSILPWAQIVDVSHAIAPQNVLQAAYVLAAAAPYFPRHTVHVAVVDPGVGTVRRPIAIFTDTACYVGPDNGIFSQVFANENVNEVRLLRNASYQRPVISNTFHGRDLFAPFAAYIAAGVPAHSLGPVIDDPVILAVSQPQRHSDGCISGQILYVDHFGNLVSNIPTAWLETAGWEFEIGGVTITSLSDTYGQVGEGALLAMGGSSGLLEIAVRNGNAAHRLACGEGASIQARPPSHPPPPPLPHTNL